MASRQWQEGDTTNGAELWADEARNVAKLVVFENGDRNSRELSAADLAALFNSIWDIFAQPEPPIGQPEPPIGEPE